MRQRPWFPLSGAFGRVFPLELTHVELALAAGVVHVAHLAKNRSFGPALVVNAADGPHAACEETQREHMTLLTLQSFSSPQMCSAKPQTMIYPQTNTDPGNPY